jgi:SAM-dependent methyltransferase
VSKKMKDVFGQALYSYWQGDKSTPYLIRREDGYVSKSSLKEYFATWLEPMEEAVTHHIKGKILDIGCGAGRHLLYFQNQGLDILGIDRSPLAIQVCKESGAQRAEVMDIFEHNLSPYSFDTILLFGHNIGIGGTLEGAKILLAELRQLICSKGRLLLSTSDISRTNRDVHLHYHHQKNVTGGYPGEIRIRIEYKDLISDWFDWLHLEPEVLKSIAEAAGWELQEAHGFYDNDYAAVLVPTS